MALIKSGTIGSGTPLLAYELHVEQTGASGNSRTIKITGKFKVNGSSSSWYGYACNWRARVHNSYGSWTAIKGTESWNGGQAYRSFSQTLTVDVGTTNSVAITVGLYTDSQIDNDWDGSATGSFTVGSTNTAPVISGTVSTSPSGIIAENTATITVTAPTATDANGNLSGYRCRVSINGGGYSEIYRGSSRSFNHNVSGYGEGTTFQYAFDCYDSAGAWSGNVYSAVVTKNRFTGDTLSSSSSIGYTDGNGSISFSFSGASNTNGNTSFTRTLSCDGITVYNATLSSSPTTVTVYRSGTAPTTPYIRFDDIKNKFASASYKGTLTFTLTTRNAYSNSRTSSKSISVNLQTTPNAVGSCNIATNANSTAYKTVASTSNKYFIPNGSDVIRVDWTAGSGKLGEAISYELYVAYGSGSWSKVATLASGTLYYNHVVPKQTSSQAIKYKVRTITGYGTYADRDTSAQTLHYYNPPSLTTGTLTRGATTCDAQVTIKSLSSIPNINTVGTWNCYNKGTTTSVSNGSLTVSQAVQTIKVTGLTDSGQYDLKVTFKDDTGFSANATVTVAIGANSPIFFVNKYGIGVNGQKADSNYATKTKGGMEISRSGDGASLLHFNTDRGWAFKQGGTGLGTSLDLVSDTSDKSFRIMPPSRNKSISFSISDTASSSIFIDGNKVYHAGSKPTPSEIGAVSSGGGTITGAITVSGESKFHNGTYTDPLSGTSCAIKATGHIANTGNLYTKGNVRFYKGDKYGAIGKGDSDVYIQNAASGKYLQFKDDGTLAISGAVIGNPAYPVIASRSGSWFNRVPVVAGDGVLEVGRYIDFHSTNGDTSGYTARLDNNGSGSLTINGSRIYTGSWCGNVPETATRISNLNSRLASGWYSWSSGTTGAPTAYGVMLQIKWDSGTDFYQIAISSDNARIFTRGYVNGGYTGWKEK